MYKQIDGISWGVHWDLLWLIFSWGLLSSPNKPVVYFRYVDDKFCIFNNESKVDLFYFTQ